MALDSVKILYKGGTAEIEVKKSRFIANLKPVESEEEAAAFIAEIKKKYKGVVYKRREELPLWQAENLLDQYRLFCL